MQQSVQQCVECRYQQPAGTAVSETYASEEQKYARRVEFIRTGNPDVLLVICRKQQRRERKKMSSAEMKQCVEAAKLFISSCEASEKLSKAVAYLEEVNRHFLVSEEYPSPVKSILGEAWSADYKQSMAQQNELPIAAAETLLHLILDLASSARRFADPCISLRIMSWDSTLMKMEMVNLLTEDEKNRVVQLFKEPIFELKEKVQSIRDTKSSKAWKAERRNEHKPLPQNISKKTQRSEVECA